MASEITQGWHDDPFRLHEQRYFSAGRPTKLVRDGKVECYDEPPAETWAPAATVVAAGGLAIAQPPPSMAGVSSSGSAGSGASGALPRRSGKGLAAGIAALAVVAVIAAVTIVGGSRSPRAPRRPAISDAAFVAESARHTLGQRTADVTVSGSIDSAGQSVAVTGTGETDFSSNSMALSVHITVSGHSLTEKEILTGGSLYFALSADGRSLAQTTGGRSWIRMPVVKSRTASLTGSDPLSTLSVLEQHGNSVRRVGTKIIGGLTCTGYAVTPSKQAMISGARKEFSRLGLPAAITDAELSMIKAMTPPTATIWLDAHGTVRQMGVSLQVGSLSSVASNLVMDFSHYGTPVRISAPAPSDVISYRSFMKADGGSGTF